MLKFNKSFASLTFAVLLAAGAVPAQQKAVKSRAWYSPYFTDAHKNERGDISELKGKRRVFVSASASDEQNSRFETVQLMQRVLNDLKKYGDLEVVKNPEEADFAASFSVTKSEYSTYCNYYVVTRGAESGDGAFTPRLLQSRSAQGIDCSNWVSRRAVSLAETLKRLGD